MTRCGWVSTWLCPDPWRAPSPMEPDEPIHDPLVALAFAAARTTRIRLATGIVILPAAQSGRPGETAGEPGLRCRTGA